MTIESRRRVAWSLLATAARVQNRMDRELRRFYLTTSSYKVLVALEGAPEAGIEIGQIGKRVGTDCPDLTRVLDRLELNEYVRRHRGSTDRRKILIQLTERGKAVLDVVCVSVEDIALMSLAALSEPDVVTLRGNLHTIYDRLSEKVTA